MATNMQSPKETNWWLWVVGALAILIVIAAAVYGFDLSGTGATDVNVAPTE